MALRGKCRTRSGRPFDRFACRWRLVSRDGLQVTHVSHARYAEDVATIRDSPPATTASHKKGISGYRSGKIDDELKTLGISAITLNILMDSVLGKGPGTGRIPYTWQGETYHANEGQLRKLDTSLLEAAEQRAVVSAILLVRNPARGGKGGESLLAHPDAEAAGTFAMPDVSSEKGANAYAGLINFMAERWSRPDGKYGRIHDWIVQNEVDAGWVWTNAGEIPAAPFMDLYQRSLRITEVLDAWMHRDEMLYRGKVRGVQLSENGFNSPGNSPQSLKEQAAAMAYVWKRIRPLASIEIWHYHNWFDNPNEGGLLLGLRTFESEGGKPKPIWHLYRDLGTPREDEACAPYLKTIGLKSWDEALLHLPGD